MGRGLMIEGFSSSPSIERLHPFPALLSHALGGACGRTFVLQPKDSFFGRRGLDRGSVAYMLLGGVVSEDRVDLLRNLKAQISSTRLHHRIHANGILQAGSRSPCSAGQMARAWQCSARSVLLGSTPRQSSPARAPRLPPDRSTLGSAGEYSPAGIASTRACGVPHHGWGGRAPAILSSWPHPSESSLGAHRLLPGFFARAACCEQHGTRRHN